MINDLEIHFFECFNNLGRRNDLNQSFRTQKYLKYFGLNLSKTAWIYALQYTFGSLTLRDILD